MSFKDMYHTFSILHIASGSAMHNGHFLLGKSDFFYCPKLENSAKISVMFDIRLFIA